MAPEAVVRIPLSVGSVYLVPGRDGYLQVDTGYRQDYPAYCQGLAKAGIAVSQIKAVFLTHHHDDHAGFLNELCQAAPLTLIANRRAKELLANGKNYSDQGGGWVSPMVRFLVQARLKLKPDWTFGFPPFLVRDQDILIEDDDCQTLRSLGFAADCLYTPGHSSDHQALRLDGGQIFCGDAASSMLLWAGTRYCTVFMSNMEVAYQSWQKMLDSGAERFFPAHGRPFLPQRLVENMGKIRTEDLLT